MLQDDSMQGIEHSITIEYALTRREILWSFLQGLAESPKFRTKILLFSAAIGMSGLLPKAILSRSLTLKDTIDAAGWAVGSIAFIALGVSVFGKTARRTLTISPNGISTEIGRLTGQVPWNKVKEVTECTQSVLIVGRNGNAFFIPNRAFADLDHRSQFLAEIKRWMHAGIEPD